MAKKILVAEDSSVIQNITKKVFQFQNFEITPVKNGAEAIKKIESENFDILLLDINMPVMNGIECAKQIRAMTDSQKAKIPIVAITGNAKNYTKEEFYNMGFNDYLQKPLNFDNLVSTVKQLTQ